MTNLDRIFKSRDITLSTKVCLVRAIVFPVVMYGCERWIQLKEAERRRIDAFELWCWRRLLRVPWTARRSNQSILKEVSPRCSLEGLMLKLKCQYFGHLIWRIDSLKRPWCWERLKAGGEGEDTGRAGWMASSIQWTWVWVNSRSWWWTRRPGVLQFMGSQWVGHNWVTELNWTELKKKNWGKGDGGQWGQETSRPWVWAKNRSRWGGLQGSLLGSMGSWVQIDSWVASGKSTWSLRLLSFLI